MTPDWSDLTARLDWPDHPVDAVIDTDTFNEIDDQFAVSLLVRSTSRITTKALFAAPFHNAKSTGAADGMRKSYEEIVRLLSLLGRDDLASVVFEGATAYLPNEDEPVRSDAAVHLTELAMAYSPERPLYVIATAAITNVASALLIAPDIAARIVIVWLGGHAHHWPDTQEFNLFQDVAAARVVMASGAALVQLPCMGVVSALTTSGPELERWLRGRSGLADYLVDITTREALAESRHATWTRPIWDVAPVAWLLDQRVTRSSLVPAPLPTYDGHYSFDSGRHPIRYVYWVDRDAVFEALFEALGRTELP